MMTSIKKNNQQNSLPHKLLSVVALLVCSNSSNAVEKSLELEEPILMRSIDEKIIDTRYFSVPTVADIDSDGKNDLLVGQFMNTQTPDGSTAGSVKWYRNVSKENELPSYDSGVDLKSKSGLVYADNW